MNGQEGGLESSAGSGVESPSGRAGSSGSQIDSDAVRGERGAPTVDSARSLQSRVSSVLAAGLMIALGLGALSWYYANALGRQKHARQAVETAAADKARGEMALPPLGGVDPPRGGPPAQSGTPPGADAESASGRQRIQEAPPAAVAPTSLSLEQARAGWNAGGGSLPPYTGADPYGSPQRQSPADRRLAGAAFARDSLQPASPAGAFGESPGTDATLIAASRAAGNPIPGNRSEDGLMTLLRPGVATPARAQTLPTQQFLLPKGAFIDCTLETAIDSTLPGMTTCVTATDTFGVDGKIVLLERGSKLVGETRGDVQNGAARVFVLWTEARTPTGVLVPLDSPGTDELGRSGLPGEVNRHFWDRFGGALLISVVDGAMQAAVQSASRGGGAIIYNPSASQGAITDVLKGTINITPTVIKHQGDRIQILVARDIDFRPVYELRSAGL
jgi:type IV secretion system protein VirB10